MVPAEVRLKLDGVRREKIVSLGTPNSFAEGQSKGPFCGHKLGMDSANHVAIASLLNSLAFYFCGTSLVFPT